MRSPDPQAELDELKRGLRQLESGLKEGYRLVVDTPLRMVQPGQLARILYEAIAQVQAMQAPKWPEPTTDEPELEELESWMIDDGGCEATDGCWVEPDGTCPHGHPSWLIRLGLI